MVSLLMMSMLLSYGLVAQAPDPPGEWIVIDSKEGPFSFGMPARPVEKSGEVTLPSGKMRWKIYTCQMGGAAFTFRQQRYPPGGQPTSTFRSIDEVEKSAKEHGAVTSKASINIQGVSGMEVATKLESPAGAIEQMGRMRVLEQGPNIYLMMAQSGPGKPLPPEADGFFNSLRFDGKPAIKPTMAVGKAATAKALAPARRKQIGKVVRDDRTADAAARTFLMAIEAGDEETLREVTLPNPDLDRLLQGEGTGAREIRELRQQVLKARVHRLKQGDRVQIVRGEIHVILPSEVGRDCAALKIQVAPADAPLQLVKGHWKVDPTPFIAARKAAEGAK